MCPLLRGNGQALIWGGEERGFSEVGGECLISQDTMWLESSPLRRGNVKLSIQTRKPWSPEDSTLLEDSTSPSTKEQEAAPGGWKKRLSWDEGKDVIVRGRDEKRCEEGERNVVQRRETVRDRDTHADTDKEKGAERETD